MLKRGCIKSLNNFCLLSFALLISTALIFGAYPTPAQAAKKVDTKNSVAGLVDINNATQKELVAVKGIGVPTAKKIIANRPYKSTDELTTKAGLDAKAVAAIKPFLTVGKDQPATLTAATAKATSAVNEKKADAQKSVAGLVDINNATQKELVAVKGIGVPTAKKIIANRPYTSTDELTTKAGLDAKAVAAIKPLLTVGAAQTSSVKSSVATKASEVDVTKAVSKTKSAAKSTATKLAPGTKININTADKATLEALPEIGSSKAQSIIDGRPYKSIEDIKKIKGIKQKTFDAIKEYLAV